VVRFHEEWEATGNSSLIDFDQRRGFRASAKGLIRNQRKVSQTKKKQFAAKLVLEAIWSSDASGGQAC